MTRKSKHITCSHGVTLTFYAPAKLAKELEIFRKRHTGRFGGPSRSKLMRMACELLLKT